jgi:Tol biopolymer transport system component
VADGRQRVAALDPNTTGLRAIVWEDVSVFDPALSPDGARIAYYRCCSGYNSQLVVRDFRSGKITEIGYARATPRWSPDGQFIAVMEDQRVRWPSVIYRSNGSGRVWTGFSIVGWLP